MLIHHCIIIALLCSCDSDEDIEIAVDEETNEVKEVKEKADNDLTNQSILNNIYVFVDIFRSSFKKFMF